MPLASTPVEGAVPRTLSDWNRARLSVSLRRVCFTDLFLRSPLSPRPRRIFLILVSRSPASTSRGSLPRLCLSRPSRSPSLCPSSLFPGNSALSLYSTRPPPSILPSRLPGFYLSLASTRSLSGNERRNTLATFNRPALSSAYTYLAGSAALPPSPPPTHALVLISILPPPLVPPSAISRAPPPGPDLPLLTSHLYHQHRI